MQDLILSMNGVSKSFGDVSVLKSVSFALHRGSVHAICGENGAGKSTLMKILSGLYKADSGEMRLDGRPYMPQRPKDAINAGIAMIYQELDLAADLTVAENVYLGNEPLKYGVMLDSEKMIAQTQSLIDEYGFKLRAETLVSDLSVAEGQVVELLKALHKKAKIIVMDEPTSALSEAEATRLFAIIDKLKEQGMAIIYITHRMDEIKRLADQVSILRDGEMVHTASINDIEVAEIIRLMVGREIKELYPQRKNVKPGKVLLSVQNLNDHQKISDISFELKAGEIVGMAGLIGAGRTEVAEAIFGIHHGVTGTVEMDGHKLERRTPEKSIANGIGYLTEDRKRNGLCLGLPCAWNITLPNLQKLGMSHVINLSRELELACQRGEEVKMRWNDPMNNAETLSGGNQQKLLLARWLMAESKVLIFDEPTRGVDVGAKKEIYNLLNALADEGKAILLISSDLSEIQGMCDRVLVMKDGHITANLPKTATQEEIMRFAAI